MTTLEELKRKYSYGPIPDWELKKLEGVKPETVSTPAPEPKRGKRAKAIEDQPAEPVTDGDSTAD